MPTRVAVCLALAVAMSGYGSVAGARQQAPRVDFAARPISSVRYLKVANPGEDDKIGIGDPLVGVTLAMSADGTTLAVSTPHEDSGATAVNGNQQDESAWDSGAAYVFVRNGSSWAQQAFVKPSNTQTSDKFGFALALSGDGNTLAVGATLEDSSARGINGNQADNSAQSSGAVYVFVRRGVVAAGLCQGVQRRCRRPVRMVGGLESRRHHARCRRAIGSERRPRHQRQ